MSTYVYTACADANCIDIFELDVEGRLTYLARQTDVTAVRALALNPQAGLIYAAQNSEPPQLSGYRIDSQTGTLSPTGDARMPETAAHLSLSNDGRTLFAASYFGGVTCSARVDEEGKIIDGAVVACTPGSYTHSAVPSLDGRHYYMASLGDDKIVRYNLAADGQLEEAGSVGTTVGAGPRHLRFSPSGQFLYLLAELSGEVYVYAREESDGSLTRVQVIDSIPDEMQMQPGALRTPDRPRPPVNSIWCADLQTGGDGKYLFTSERSGSTVTTFSIDPQTGQLQFLGLTPTEKQPRGIATDPDGRYLLVTGERSHGLSVYRIDPETGTLSLTDRAETGRGPLWVMTYRPEAYL